MAFRVDQLVSLVEDWAVARNITRAGGARASTQLRKTEEGIQALKDAFAKGDLASARDAYGDIFITLIVGARIIGMDIGDCIENAWHGIKDQEGVLVDGVFVPDLPINGSVVVYGPSGCGKTFNAQRLAKHFGLREIHDNAFTTPTTIHHFGVLYLTKLNREDIPSVMRNVVALKDLPDFARPM